MKAAEAKRISNKRAAAAAATAAATNADKVKTKAERANTNAVLAKTTQETAARNSLRIKGKMTLLPTANSNSNSATANEAAVMANEV